MFVKKPVENNIFSILIYVIAGLLIFAAGIAASSFFKPSESYGENVVIGESSVPLASSPRTQEELNAAYPIDKSLRDGNPVSFVPVNYADPPWEAVFPELEAQYEAAVALGYDDFTQIKCEYIYNGINKKRVQEGIEPLLLNTSGNLYKLTYVRAAEIMELYSHDRPDGTNSITVMADSYIGGEILNGQPTVYETLQTWFDSPTHLEAILNPLFTEMAVVGFEPEEGETYGREAVVFGINSCEY